MKYCFLLFLPVTILFSSCSIVPQTAGRSFVMFAILFVLLIALLWFINKKRGRSKKETASVVAFNENLQSILEKLDTPRKRIDALNYAFERVELNEEYNKNMAWKNSLLVTVYLHLVLEYHSANDMDMVLSTCNDILILNPKHAITYYNRAHILRARGRLAESLEDYRKFLELDKKEYSSLRPEVEEAIGEIERQI